MIRLIKVCVVCLPIILRGDFDDSVLSSRSLDGQGFAANTGQSRGEGKFAKLITAADSKVSCRAVTKTMIVFVWMFGVTRQACGVAHIDGV